MICRWGAVAGLAATLIATTATAAENNWATPHAPFKVFGNTYYVGTEGITAILIASDAGHILIDGAVPEAAKLIAANIQTLGFKPTDVKVILNTHAHFDHAGGIAELKRLTGARIKASAASAPALSTGKVNAGDPQAAVLSAMQPAGDVEILKDSEVVSVGAATAKAVFTPGHTPGGTTWSWQACEGARCVSVVFADSLTAVSAPGFRFTDTPNGISDFEKSFGIVSALPCDILISAHPEFSGLWQRLAKHEAGDANGLIDPTACRRYVEGARAGLEKRIATEKGR